jgi:hypothetical protein
MAGMAVWKPRQRWMARRGPTKTLMHAADGVVETGVWGRTTSQIVCAAAGMGYTSVCILASGKGTLLPRKERYGKCLTRSWLLRTLAGNDPLHSQHVDVKVTHICRLEDVHW